MQHTLRKTLGFTAVVALGIMVPIRFSPETTTLTVTNACAQSGIDNEIVASGGSCKPNSGWDCIIDGFLRTDKCRAGDQGC
jgi:hypothetical protein